MIIAVIFLVFIGVFTLLVAIGAAKSNKELDAILDQHITFERIKFEKSKFFDNHITVRNLSDEIIAIVCNDGIEKVKHNISLQEYSELNYIQQNFNKIWIGLNI